MRGEIRGEKEVMQAQPTGAGKRGRERYGRSRAAKHGLTPFPQGAAKDTLPLFRETHTGSGFIRKRDRARVRFAPFCPLHAPSRSSAVRRGAARQIRLRIVSSRSLILSTGFKRMEHRVSLVEAPSTVSAGNGLPMPG